MKFYKHLKKAAAAAVVLSIATASIPCFAAENESTIKGLSEGYYDITASYTNTSVDGSCYMWAKSSSVTEASTVLPKTTSTSGSTVVVKGVYVKDGTIKYGLYNDGVSTASLTNVTAKKTKPYTFLNGGDITEYNYIKGMGGKYYDADNNEVNAISYLGDMGMNACRIRLTNAPGKGHGDGTYYLPEGYQDEADCQKLALEAKAAGMQIVYTFNYSDYWSNGLRQRIPSDWVSQIKTELGYDIEDYTFLSSMTAAQKSAIQTKLGDILYKYTFDVMTNLKNQGTAPEYVSLGNEINGGMFFPFGNTYDCWLDTDDYGLEFEAADNNISCVKDYSGLAKILNRGYDAVKAVSPKTQIIMHLASDGDFSYSNYLNWWYNAYKSSGGKWDVTGISYYPSWTTQTASVCKTRVNELSSSFSKPVILMEAGFNWTDKRKDGYNGQLFNIDAYKDIYPDTQSGHKGFMTELVNYMKQADNCLGILYWDPLMIHVEDPKTKNASLSGWAYRESDNGVEANVVENTTLFDFNGKAISTVNLYRDSKNSGDNAPEAEIAFKPNDGKNDDMVDADIKNRWDDKKLPVVIMVAKYNKDGTLLDVKVQRNEIEPNSKKNINIECPGFVDDNKSNVKVFVWNSENKEAIIKKTDIK